MIHGDSQKVLGFFGMLNFEFFMASVGRVSHYRRNTVDSECALDVLSEGLSFGDATCHEST